MSRLLMIERRISLPLRFVFLGCILTSCFLVIPPVAEAAPRPNFQIRVPHKSPRLDIFILKITVSVTTTVGPIDITLARNDGATVTATAFNLSPGTNSPNIPIGPSGNQDIMKVFSPLLTDTDLAKKKYVIVLTLNSNVVASTCLPPGGTPPAGPDETWTVSVTGTGAAAGAQFDGACVQSLDRNNGAGGCLTTNRTIPLNDTPVPTDAVATIVGEAASDLGCRPGVDAVLVLDRSGSMSSGVGIAPNPLQPKFDALKSAVSTFMTTWSLLRTNEATTGMAGNPIIVSPTDRVGVAFFDSSASWLKDLDPSSATTTSAASPTLDVFSDTLANDIRNSLRTPGPIVTAGSTSIGSGLRLGDAPLNLLRDNGNRQVFIVLTDGFENTPPTTRINMADSTNVETVAGGVGTSLASQPPAQIFTMTIGGTGTIDPTISAHLADASNGFYLNSENDPVMFTSFFTEVLQNFIKYSTVETYRMISKETPFTNSVPVTTTTTSLTFALSWSASRGALKLTVTPPAGGGQIVRRVAASDAPGSIVLNVPVPSRGINVAGGTWGINIEVDSTGIDAPTGPALKVPFNLIVLGDDTSINSDLTTVAADYAPGDQIRLRAKITELGEPVIGATVVADLVRPDAGGIGDLLSNSTASTSQPASPDQLSAADAKLRNTLAADPTALRHAEGPVPLFDNGNAANGDAVAGDGVYSALFPTQLIGHYNFTIGAVGPTQNAGTFSRQQLRTVHVRTLPDVSRTTASATVKPRSSVLVVNLTPLTKFGNHIGPGWGNYLWVTGNGITPTKFGDNLNGTYTASVPITGFPPTDIDIHFERVNERIPYDARPDQLPVPLGNGTVVVPHVPVTGGPGGAFRRWGLSLHAGVSIPHGNLNNVFNPGPNFAFDLEYRFNPTFSLEGIYGYHRLRGETFGAFTLSDLNVHQFSVNGKVYGSSSPVRPFFNFGGGAYVFTPGVSTHGGLNIGGGVQFDVTPNFAVEGVYNFHSVFTSGSNTQFSGVQGGVRFRF